MKKVIRLTESDLVKVIKKIIKEQTATNHTAEKIIDFPGKSIEEIHKLIVNNPTVRSGGRLVDDNPNLVRYSTTFKVDAPQLKNAKIPFLMGQCHIGSYDFDLTFYIKEGKTKLVVDNFRPDTLRRIIAGGGGAPCNPNFQNFGVLTKEAPNQNKLSSNYGIWSQMIKLFDGNMPLYLDKIAESFTNPTSASVDPFDF